MQNELFHENGKPSSEDIQESRMFVVRNPMARVGTGSVTCRRRLKKPPRRVSGGEKLPKRCVSIELAQGN